jgi:hypothetical protein
VEKHQSSWLRSAETEQGLHLEPLPLVRFRRRLFDIGCSVVFCPDYTRVVFQTADSHPVLLAARSSPRLFAAYVSGLRAHKLTVFLDQSASTGGLAKRIRGAARELFSRSVSKCDWPAIAQIVQSAEELQVVDDEWAGDFGALVESGTQTLGRPWTGASCFIFRGGGF